MLMMRPNPRSFIPGITALHIMAVLTKFICRLSIICARSSHTTLRLAAHAGLGLRAGAAPAPRS